MKICGVLHGSRVMPSLACLGAKLKLLSLTGASPGRKHLPLGEERLMLNVDRGLYHSLNAVAARIWNLLEQWATENVQPCR